MAPYKFCFGLVALMMSLAGPARAGQAAAALPVFPVLALTTNDRVMVLAPHPDDESLACGGVIQAAVQRRIPVRVAFLTYGDNNQWSFAVYRKHPVLESKAVQGMGLMRHGEAVRAARQLGLEESRLTFLGYPDFGTLHIWNACWGAHPPYKGMLTKATAVPYANAFRPGARFTGENILQDLAAILRDFKPTKVFVSHPADHNPDHRALYLFTRVALWNLESELRPQLLPYLTHFKRWPQPRGLFAARALEPPGPMRRAASWSVFPLGSNAVSGKLAALKAHASQFRYSAKYLLSFVRQNELFGDLPAINLQKPHEFDPAAPPPANDAPDLPEELTDEERDAYTGVEWNYARREGDTLALAIAVSRPLAQSVEAEVSIFGYRPDRPFHDMPKLRVALGERNHRVMDGMRRLDDSVAPATYRNKSITLRVPLSALGNPDRILISARTARAQVPLDWVAWRILTLPADQAARKP